MIYNIPQINTIFLENFGYCSTGSGVTDSGTNAINLCGDGGSVSCNSGTSGSSWLSCYCNTGGANSGQTGGRGCYPTGNSKTNGGYFGLCNTGISNADKAISGTCSTGGCKV